MAKRCTANSTGIRGNSSFLSLTACKPDWSQAPTSASTSQLVRLMTLPGRWQLILELYAGYSNGFVGIPGGFPFVRIGSTYRADLGNSVFVGLQRRQLVASLL